MFWFFPLPLFWKTLLSSLIALSTLVGIMVRPFRWNEARIAMGGAGVLILLGLITPADALSTLVRDWNTFLFFLGMMALSTLAEAAGLFGWLGAQAARFAGGSAARLFLNIFLLGTLISMLFSNDATALILTPIVYVLVTKLRLPVLPYLFACTFIADSASFLLPVSNPINIIILSRHPMELLTFVRLLSLPSVVVIGINIGIFYLLYRRADHGHLRRRAPALTGKSSQAPGIFSLHLLRAAAVAPAYIAAAAVHFPLSSVAMIGAALLLLGGLYWRRTTLLSTSKGISWSIFGFIAGMFIVVRAVEETGLTEKFGSLLLRL